MEALPESLRQRLRKYGQEHVLAWWDKLSDPQRRELAAQVQALDLEQLRELYAGRDQITSLPSPERLAPVPVIREGTDQEDAVRRGEEALRCGEVAVLMVAGGQGSRLGFEHPK